MARVSLVEFACIVAVGLAMVEVASGDRHSHELDASSLAAKMAAVAGTDLARVVTVSQPIRKRP